MQKTGKERIESNMESYTSFAEVYDQFMDNVPYEAWADFLQEILQKEGIRDGLVLDLGCGTGSMTEALAARGYDMIGVDNSEEMLEIAMEKRVETGHDILYLQQDMQAFELYGTVRAVISVCDCVNYLTDPEELEEVFRLVNNYLDPEGIFIFDFNTQYKYRELLGIRPLQRTGRTQALSGIIIITKKKRSTSMTDPFHPGRRRRILPEISGDTFSEGIYPGRDPGTFDAGGALLSCGL